MLFLKFYCFARVPLNVLEIRTTMLLIVLKTDFIKKETVFVIHILVLWPFEGYIT